VGGLRTKDPVFRGIIGIGIGAGKARGSQAQMDVTAAKCGLGGPAGGGGPERSDERGIGEKILYPVCRRKPTN